MGHYDDCREAEEDRRVEQDGEHLKSLVRLLSDRDAGLLKRALFGALAEVKNMSGTRDQHASLKRHEEVVDRITGRRL